MTERTWMKIHNGLNDPKHRAAIGVRLWLFMHLIDRADWETGIVWHFRDGAAAEELDMPLDTIRRQRHELRDAGYIKSFAGEQCQHIMIMRWRNPRLVNPPQINMPDGGLSEIPYSPPKVTTHPDAKVTTPTIRSESITPSPAAILFKTETGDDIPSLTWLEVLTELMEKHGIDKLRYAIKEGEIHGARNPAYYRAVCENPYNGKGHKAEKPVLGGMPASKRKEV